MLIELQVGTKLQHAWATAVEAMGAAQKNALKASEGDPNTLRFFQLVSGLFAMEEGYPLADNIPQTVESITAELREIEDAYTLIGKLRAIKAMTEKDALRGNSKGYYLLDMDYSTNRMNVYKYKPRHIKAATEKYNELELRSRDPESKKDAVLLSAESITQLRRLYPNYFSDLTNFVKLIDKYLLRSK